LPFFLKEAYSNATYNSRASLSLLSILLKGDPRMPSFMGSDGSACVGGLNPSGIVQAVHIDAQGNLLIAINGGNVDSAALISASGATTDQNSADQTNPNARGVKVVLDMTNVGTGSVTLTIQGKDAASGKYYTILASAAIVTNSTNVYTVYPGITAAANISASDVLPAKWRIKITANNANPTTFTIGASVLI
jgi:hypothetical protein